MTNPQGPPHGDPRLWARPTESIPTQPAPARPEQPTQHIPRAASPMDGPTQHIPRAGQPAAETAPPPPKGTTDPVKKKRRLRLGDPLSIVLIVVIVLALVAAGLLAGELYARHEADSRVAAATECVVQDKATVSFGATPFLLQRLQGHYRNISITTAGNQIKSAKRMTAQVKIDDVRLQPSGNSKGTIGSLDATITWTADGIKQTIQNAIPLIGSFVTAVKTNPSDGTIDLQSAFGSITAKPQVVNNALSLQVVSLTGLGFTLPSESVQPTLDAFTNQLANNYPLGIHADSVQVTDTGVSGHFSTRNAAIPQGNTDPCFANL